MLPTTASSRIALPALRGWPLFIALSLLVHLLLFGLLARHTPERMQTGEQSVAPLTVHIDTKGTPRNSVAANREPRATPPAAPAKNRLAQQSESAAPALRDPVQASIAIAPPAHHEERMLGTSQRLLDSFPDAGGPSKAAESDNAPDDETPMQIAAQIRTRFADHFVYPLVAQRHSWQGEVILAFHVGIDGTISNATVMRSSGHAVLDQAALDSLRAIRRIEFSAGVTLQQILELRMPVIYQIAQG